MAFLRTETGAAARRADGNATAHAAPVPVPTNGQCPLPDLHTYLQPIDQQLARLRLWSYLKMSQ